jgi:hypothetical protein
MFVFDSAEGAENRKRKWGASGFVGKTIGTGTVDKTVVKALTNLGSGNVNLDLNRNGKEKQ